MKFSLIIPTVRQTALVKSCIETIRKHETNVDEYEIIVVDDGSDQRVHAWLKSCLSKEKNTRLFTKSENRGFAHTVNMGLREAVGDYLILVNNDVQFIKPILRHVEATFNKREEVGVIGAKLLFPPGTRVQHAGVVRIPGRANFIHINKNTNRGNVSVNKSRYFPSVTGALYAIRRECWNDVGNWNENYFLSCEDTEYSIRCWVKGWHVFYDHNVEAIHIEGHTRGNTDNIKKRKDLQWFIKERQTIPKFAQDVQKYDLEGIDVMINQLNSSVDLGSRTRPVSNHIHKKPSKIFETPSKQSTPQTPEAPPSPPKKRLEIGCGEFPQPGYIHLDIRKFAHVDVVCDFSKEKLPFKDGEIAEILSNHSIEHVPWRRLSHVLSEWNRVLEPGGKVFFRTPDLEFICRSYLAGRVTKEHPNDEGYVTKHYASKVTPGWWAIIKLFAGQDYDGNYHYFAFDFETAKATLERYGFERVTRLKIQPEFSPGELQVEAYKPEKKVKAQVIEKDPVERILLKRKGALGDVILTTPIARRLRELHGADAVIHVATDSGVVYLNNQWIDQVLPGRTPPGGYTKFIDLDLSYEKTPERHIIDSYAERAGLTQDFDKRTELFASDGDIKYVDTLLADHSLTPSECVVVHMAVTWKNRTWPKDYWHKTLRLLTAKGYKVIVIGHGSDIFIQDHNVYNFMRKLSIQQIAQLVSVSRCFVANDSGMIHVAGTTDTKIVGLFTTAKGEYRMPYRQGQMGYNCRILKPKVDCYGCLHKQKPPVVYADCGRGDYKCLSEITPEMVVEAIG